MARTQRHKILIVGDWRWPWYQEACAQALEELGHEVVRFGWSERFVVAKDQPAFSMRLSRLFASVQARVLWGPIIGAIRRDLVAITARHKPNIVFFYNVQLIDAASVRAMRQAAPGAIFCQYANDNPFSRKAAAGWWRHFIGSIPLFDVHFAYRHGDFENYRRRGATRVHLLRSYFIPAEDRPLSADELDPRYECDAVFVGHYEEDGRLAALEAIAHAGFKLKLFGSGWEQALPIMKPDSPLRSLFPIKPVYGDEYRQAICGAKVALCFLSHLNNDTYTRRNFQIPAMATAMVSQHTDDLASLYHADAEAAFFRSQSELVCKVGWLLGDSAARQRLAQAGHDRVHRDGHDVLSRMRQMLTELIICKS